jgi:hypothetical protein
MAYDFFAFPNLSASFGFTTNGRRVLVHVASQGGTTTGERRNPDRAEAFPRLIDALWEVVPSAEVEAVRHGRLDTPWTVVRKRLDTGGVEALKQGLGAGGGFRFDFVCGVTEFRPSSSLRRNRL